MIARAEAKYLRISPSKAKLVVDLVRGEQVDKAMSVLRAVNKKGAYYLRKVLHSAIANAKNKGYESTSLYISKVLANPGPFLKRFRAATFGRASSIRKRMSHIVVELESRDKKIGKVKVR